MSEESTLPKLLTAAEVSAATGISKFRLYALVRLELMPAIRLGRSVRFDPRRLAEWLDAGGTESLLSGD